MLSINFLLLLIMCCLTGCGVPNSYYLHKPNITTRQITKDYQDCSIKALTGFQGNNQIVNSVGEGFAKDMNNANDKERWKRGCMMQKGYVFCSEGYMNKNVKNWDKKFYNHQFDGFLHKTIWSIDMPQFRKNYPMYDDNSQIDSNDSDDIVAMKQPIESKTALQPVDNQVSEGGRAKMTHF